jgi:hypothetical protein
MAVNPETIDDGSGIEAAEMMTVPGVLVNGTAESSAPVLKSKLSKKLFGFWEIWERRGMTEIPSRFFGVWPGI